MSEMPTLDAAQQAAIDAYLQMDSGLVTLSSVPGAGKSTAASKVYADELLDRAANGQRVPHERIVSISFSKEDASQIIPDVIAWIKTLHERGETPDCLSEADISELITHVREASQIGTVDSLLRSVFKEVATELGFDGCQRWAIWHSIPISTAMSVSGLLHTHRFKTTSADSVRPIRAVNIRWMSGIFSESRFVLLAVEILRSRNSPAVSRKLSSRITVATSQTVLMTYSR